MTIPSLRKSRFGIVLLMLLLVVYSFSWQTHSQGTTAQGVCDPNSNNIKYAMYFRSRPQDASECAMSVKDGKIVFASTVANPALTCPDAFAWKLLSEAVTQQFWKNWAADQYTWPNNPLPPCVAGSDPAKCCNPANRNNPGYNNKDNPAISCPYFPGDHLEQYAATGGMPLRIGVQPSKAHLVSFAADPQIKAALAAPDPGRKIRQAMAELVFRNKPMFDYVFRNNLYHQEGITAVFKNNSNNLNGAAPYRVPRSASAVAEIDFPTPAVMIKSNWINKERALKIGLRDDPANPYIKMTILSAVTDDNGTIFEPGEHWLVALHISSKDTPNWAWATFEHVNNPGRCDYTGCNDSYGYSSADTVAQGLANNYTQPKSKCDGLLLPSWIFDTGKVYPGGAISASLKGVFNGLGIGNRDNPTLNNRTIVPAPADKAWLSYRLKGSQTEFTDSMGRATRLGNSVTEGGFMNSSSCISCHARAGTTANGTLPPALGVFINELSDTGYGMSANGLPVPDWYHRSAQPPSLTVLQTDFVWGFLFANSLTQPPAATPQNKARSIRDIR